MSSPPMRTNSSETVLEVKDTGVIWSAILGGTIAGLAFLLLLAPLGAGLGYLTVSPWNAMDTSAKTFTMMSAVWLILMQWISSGIGGYLTGRLRTGWVGAHTHEVFFRDTAHGFLTWALTAVLSLCLVTAAGVVHESHMHQPAGHSMAMDNMPESYAVNRLFRNSLPNANISEQDRADASMIMKEAASEQKNMPDEDLVYLRRLVAVRTGLSPDDAQRRIDDTISRLRETRHEMHKTMAVAGIFIFLSMWIGAFIASAAGALGGQHRDLHYRTGSLSAPE